MINSGATALFLDQQFINQHQIRTFLLKTPVNLYNIDGSPNTAGRITHYTQLYLSIDGYKDWMDFLITNLGGEAVILGLPWRKSYQRLAKGMGPCTLRRTKERI